MLQWERFIFIIEQEEKMKEWVLFILFILAGAGMLGAGIFYWRKERDDLDSVKIYRTVTIIGAVIVLLSLVLKFLV